MWPPRQPIPYIQQTVDLYKRLLSRLADVALALGFTRHAEEGHACFDGVRGVECDANELGFGVGGAGAVGDGDAEHRFVGEEGVAPGYRLEVSNRVSGGLAV